MEIETNGGISGSERQQSSYRSTLSRRIALCDSKYAATADFSSRVAGVRAKASDYSSQNTSNGLFVINDNERKCGRCYALLGIMKVVAISQFDVA